MKWDKIADKCLCKYYHKWQTEKLADKLGCSVKAVRERAFVLNITTSPIRSIKVEVHDGYTKRIHRCI